MESLKALGADVETVRPSSRPVRVIYEHGAGSTLSEMICNPRFCEHLMGWPIGWTGCAGQVTEFAAWLRRSRGALSKLLTSDNSPLRAPSN